MSRRPRRRIGNVMLCTHCGDWHPLDDFAPLRGTYRRSRCNDCEREYSRERNSNAYSQREMPAGLHPEALVR
jgi:NAD-dependent SIR2 family protein deacetylase